MICTKHIYDYHNYTMKKWYFKTSQVHFIYAPTTKKALEEIWEFVFCWLQPLNFQFSPLAAWNRCCPFSTAKSSYRIGDGLWLGTLDYSDRVNRTEKRWILGPLQGSKIAFWKKGTTQKDIVNDQIIGRWKQPQPGNDSVANQQIWFWRKRVPNQSYFASFKRKQIHFHWN